MTRSSGNLQLPSIQIDAQGAEDFDKEFCPRVTRFAVEQGKEVWGTVNGLYVVVAHPDGKYETYLTRELHPDIQRIVRSRAYLSDTGEGKV